MTTLILKDPAGLVMDLQMARFLAGGEPPIHVDEEHDGSRRIISVHVADIDPARDIVLGVEGGLLRLRGERRALIQAQDASTARWSTFEEVFPLAHGTDPAHITAEYIGGVLTIVIPVLQPEEGVDIEVARRRTGSAR